MQSFFARMYGLESPKIVPFLREGWFHTIMAVAQKWFQYKVRVTALLEEVLNHLKSIGLKKILLPLSHPTGQNLRWCLANKFRRRCIIFVSVWFFLFYDSVSDFFGSENLPNMRLFFVNERNWRFFTFISSWSTKTVW